MHFAQLMEQDRFQEYNHAYLSGHFKSIELDITVAPKVPVALFVGKDDQFSTTKDARKIRDTL